MNRLDSAAVLAATTLGIEPHAGQVRYLLNSALGIGDSLDV
jgi:hypothetical protein